jgi:hypothetical protein
MRKKVTEEALWTLDPTQTNLVVTHTQKKKGQLRFMKYMDTDKFLGFVVFGGGSGRNAGAPVVQPIYEATLHLKPAGGKDVDTRYTFTTHEVGERLSGRSYVEDPDGVTLASIASMALGFLQQRTESAKRMRDRGLERDVAAFKEFAARLGIKLPEPKKKPKRTTRAKVCTCAGIPAGGPCNACKKEGSARRVRRR